ncbi:MAG: Gfo/Idh/MocA family protein, partial [Verrucomicrobiia bacterium]
MTSRVRVGFVGVGNMGQCAHLRNYVAVPECEVVALAELRPKLGEAVARKYGVPRVYRTAEEMLAKEKLDGIVASQRYTMHGQIIPPLYAAGVPIFTEKPLAGSIEVGEQMLAALRASGTWQMVGYHKRSDPATMWAKAEIDRLSASGEIGKLRYVRIVMPAGDWIAGGFDGLVQTDEKPPDLSSDPAARDMDPDAWKAWLGFVNYYIHQVNLLRHLLGEPYRVTFADKAGMLLVGETARGVTGTIEMSPYSTTRDWQESALVCFERGWVRLDLPAPLVMNRPGSVTVFRDPGNGATPTTTTPVLPPVHAMRQQAIHFVRAI